MFQLRDFNSLTLGMINHAKATQSHLTDFTVGSAGRTLLEASAIEIEEFYQRMLAGILDAIPTAVYRAFDFTLYPSAYARGEIVISFAIPLTDPVTIPAGTIFSNPTASIRYLAEAAATANAGAVSLSVMAVCAVVGTSGNTTADTITQIVGFNLSNTATVGNTAFASGTDGESEEQRMARFADFIGSLVRGTPSAVAQAARHMALYDSGGLITEYIARAGYTESRGWAGLYVYSGGGMPSAAMLEAVQQALDGSISGSTVIAGWRPCGIKVTVYPMFEQTINLGLLIWKFTGASETAIEDGIQTAVANLFASTPNNTTLYLAQIIETILSVSGVQKCITTNTENPVLAADNVLKLGAVTIAWQN